MTTDAAPSRVEVYLDGGDEPIGVYHPPARFQLDTAALEDGPHELRVVATDRSGHRGVRTIPFEVRNGPGIAVDGLKRGDVVEGELDLLVNAYGGAHEENWEPARAETPAPIPTWAWVLLLGVVAWAMFYAARTWSPSPEMAGSPTFSDWTTAARPDGAAAQSPSAGSGTGAALYRTSCASCHQTNGVGVEGVFPPLAGDPVVLDPDPTRHIEIILFGLQGEPIQGVDYPTAMPGWAEQLSDAEVAAVVNHERTSWGNQAPTATADQVAEVRRRGSS
ncbi:MAG: c-type cytochrome [Longimicrobiales bacterium]|nr:c-type cytochrome [Longimicrobiales bacterium]